MARTKMTEEQKAAKAAERKAEKTKLSKMDLIEAIMNGKDVDAERKAKVEAMIKKLEEVVAELKAIF